MARINPDKLVRNFKVRSSKFGQLEVFWDIPTSFVDGEEIVVARRKDAFPVEIRNRNYEDRYTDVAQVEVFKGAPIFCSHLLVNQNELIVAGDNSFTPAQSGGLEIDSKLVGRLIRDSSGQVFRITDNTATTITVQNISTNPAQQVQAVEGGFVILADYPSAARAQQTIPLLTNANTLKVVSNSFLASDKITINNTVDLTFGVEWSAGASAAETALNIRNAIISSGVLYAPEVYDDTILIERNTETTLVVTSNTLSLSVTPYAAAQGMAFIASNTLSTNEVRYLAVQDGDASTHLIKSNDSKIIRLYDSSIAPNSDIVILNSFHNTYPCAFIDDYRSFLEALTKQGSGLEADTFYYYTAFTSPITSFTVMSNEYTDGGEDLTPYTVDKIASYYTRIFYESIQYLNPVDSTFTYNDASGLITYTDLPDLTSSQVQVGDLFADSQGLRYSITSIANANVGQISVAPLSGVSTEVRSQLHGCITRAKTPFNFSSVLVNDTFKDLAGNSFPIVATNLAPLSGLNTPPGNAFDILQGLVDEIVELNTYLVPFSYNPADGHVQYGERQVTQNTLLSTFSYNPVSGLIDYAAGINLNDVEVGDLFVDGSNNKFPIITVNPQAGQLTIAILQTVDLTINSRRSGSVIDLVGFTDAEGNYLINLNQVEQFDLFKTNSKSVYVINEANALDAYVVIEIGLDSISVAMESEFDGSILRRGADVAWIGFNGEFTPTLENLAQGGVKRYNSVNNAQYAVFSNKLSTQSFGVHADDRQMGKLLYESFPNVFRVLDTTNDLQDLMEVFGHEFNDMYALITKYELQNASIVTPSVLQIASQNAGFDLVAENLGIDTRRRVMRDIISCYKLKGNRDGIAKFIRVLTTWDITNGTGDTRGAIIDDIPSSVGLRFYSPSLGPLNTNLVDTLNVQTPPAGRFVKGVPGLALPGFFDVKEVIIELPNVALEIGASSNLTYFQGNTVINDSTASLGLPNSLVGCFIIPNEGSPNDFYEITANSATTVTVSGTVPFSSLGAKYVILSPLNLARFVALSRSLPKFMPYNTVAVFNFTIQTL